MDFPTPPHPYTGHALVVTPIAKQCTELNGPFGWKEGKYKMKKKILSASLDEC